MSYNKHREIRSVTMKNVQCPFCSQTQNIEGFRPMDFSCPYCGSFASWYAGELNGEQRGFIKWSANELTSDYIYNYYFSGVVNNIYGAEEDNITARIECITVEETVDATYENLVLAVENAISSEEQKEQDCLENEDAAGATACRAAITEMQAELTSAESVYSGDFQSAKDYVEESFSSLEAVLENDEAGIEEDISATCSQIEGYNQEDLSSDDEVTEYSSEDEWASLVDFYSSSVQGVISDIQTDKAMNISSLMYSLAQFTEILVPISS